MWIHIEDDAAACAIIPTRPLAGLLAAVEHPPTELEPEASNASERAARGERGKLLQPRKMHLVLDHAMLAAARLRLLQQGQTLRGGRRHRLLAIHVLAGGHCPFHHPAPLPPPRPLP